MEFDDVAEVVRHRMSRIRGKHTKPELLLRRSLHALGYRYRLHGKGLPGSPDIVFPTRKKIVWVHGCFWHWHDDAQCPIAKTPKTRTEYWIAKLTRNRARDKRNETAIASRGWSWLIVWECQLSATQLPTTLQQVRAFLEG
jgi:DNA mismatch endonuclease (patch repair protein)